MRNIRIETVVEKLIGTKSELLESLKIAALMFAVTAIYKTISINLISGYELNIYEFVGTWTGLICVWLSRTTNILAWPFGIISSISLGVFFSQIGLPGQQWLNWIYFTLIQIWSWPHWAFGGAELSRLPITKLNFPKRIFTLLAIITGTVLVYMLINYFAPTSSYPWLDSLVVAASVVAQYLLGRKKIEAWVLWLGPVNLLSIILFFLTGAYTLMVLYIAFFIHAVFALKTWSKEIEK